MQQISRHINFNKFVEQRSVEIAKFLNDLEMDTKKTGHQALPKSVRRRAMSHNRYRIPLKLRKNFDQDLQKAQKMQKLPKCRKHIRKRRHLIYAYKLRDTKNKWLSTHLWAARRMRMVDYYGFKVAFTPNNKSFRSAYRYTRHACTLTDMSYMHAICMISKEEQQLPVQIHLKMGKYPEVGKIYEGQIVNEGKLICPGFLLRCKSSQNEVVLRFFFHPAALEQIQKLKVPKSWSVMLEQGQTDLYLLNGPQSLAILEQGLKKYGVVSQNESIAASLSLSQYATRCFSSQINYSLNNKPTISTPIPEEKLLVKGYNVNSNQMIRAHMKTLLEKADISQSAQVAKDLCFWDVYNQGQNHQLQKTKFKITLRTRYTHKRKSKMTKKEKKQMIKAQRQSSSQPRQRKKKDESEFSQNSMVQKSVYIESLPKKEAVMQAVQPILVGKCKQFYYVWVTNSDSCRFWRILSRLNVKVIGRKQLSHHYLQSQIRLFPEDYPETEAFKKYRLQQINKNFCKYKRMPLQKRHNYIKLNSPSPFCTITPLSPFSVSVEMVSRGNCQKFSYICELSAEDLSKISSELQLGRVGIVLSQQGEGQRKKYKQLPQIESDLIQLSPNRKIIGSITSGGYFYSKSKEGGIGFINSSQVSQNYLQKFNNYVLIRKVSSPHYMLAQLTPLV